MKTLVADTNIFLRFLTKDILEQAEKVKKIFYEAQRGKFKIRVFNITVVEIIFQLQHWYKFSKEETVNKLILLFSPSWISLDDKEVVFEALEIYKNTNIDFVDLLTWCIAKKDGFFILSFDKDFDKLKPKLRFCL